MKFPKRNCVNNERKVSSFTGEKASLKMSDPNENYPLPIIVHVHTSIFNFRAPKFSHLATKKNQSSDRVCKAFFVENKAPKLLPDF
jgi:hypothetical protein